MVQSCSVKVVVCAATEHTPSLPDVGDGMGLVSNTWAVVFAWPR